MKGVCFHSSKYWRTGMSHRSYLKEIWPRLRANELDFTSSLCGVRKYLLSVAGSSVLCYYVHETIEKTVWFNYNAMTGDFQTSSERYMGQWRPRAQLTDAGVDTPKAVNGDNKVRSCHLRGGSDRRSLRPLTNLMQCEIKSARWFFRWSRRMLNIIFSCEDRYRYSRKRVNVVNHCVEIRQ